MGLRYPDQVHSDYFYLTTTFREWRRLGDIPGMFEGMSRSIRSCLEKYNARLLGYTLMPSHIHLLLNINGADLGSFMRDFKKYVAQKVARNLEIQGGIWMPRYDRVAIESDYVLRVKLGYIHRNPVEAGLVADPSGWGWSSARDYFTNESSAIPVWKDWA